MNISGHSIGSINLTSIADVHALLEALNLKPAKSLGQNFLVDANILGIILKTASLAPADQVLEIGTGLGALTEALAKQARRIVTVEKDSRLAEFLRVRFQAQVRPPEAATENCSRPRRGRSGVDAPGYNIELIIADAMRLDLRKYWASGINKLVANLPYSVGSALLADIFKSDIRPDMIVVTLQVEVARRLAAGPDDEDYGLLSIWSQLNYETEICRMISPNCFFPRPEVNSAITRLVRRRNAVEPADRAFFFALTKCAFGQRRKQLQKILSGAPLQFRRPAPELQGLLRELGIDPRVRPEELSIGQWVRFCDRLGR